MNSFFVNGMLPD